MTPPRKIRAEEQIGGKSLELGGAASFEGNAPGVIKLNESTPGAKDASFTLQGDANIIGGLSVNGAPINQTFTFVQLSAQTVWTINHGMNKKPSVMIVTSAGDEVIGDVHYVDDNTLTVSFTAAFGGKAFLN